jgi:hypothetical protein
MKRREFLELVKEAATTRGNPDDSASLNGIALHHERRMVSKAGAIAFLKWQALFFDGSWDANELEQCSFLFKRVDMI